MHDRTKIGIRPNGPVVYSFLALKDDNHSLPANEQEALANFDSFADTFFGSQNDFLQRTETLVREAD